MTRRELLGGVGALCVGVSLGVGCGGASERRVRHARRTGELAANLYITVLPSGRVRVTVDKAEIGQGVVTGYATLVAEELEIELDDIDHVFADSLPEYRLNFDGIPMFKIQMTGGSTSMKAAWKPLRRAAAAAREMLVAAAAKKWGVRAGSCRAEGGRVVHSSSGRSLGYGELTVDAARLDVPDSPRLKKPGDFRLIGKRAARSDVESKVRGTAIFGIDVEVEGKVCAAVIHAPTYGGRPSAIRADAARSMRGVIDVFGFRWGVAVVAEKYWQARAAAARVEVDWAPGASAGLDTAAMAAAARRYTGSGAPARDDGDAASMTGGDKATQVVYQTPHLAHAPLEPQNCVARIDGDRAEIWAPTQAPTVVQEAVADALGIDPDDVLVHTTYCGGGFGRRLLGDFAVQAALIARKVGKPVQMIWSRESDMAQGFYRPAATAIMKGRVENGRVAALSVHSISQPLIPYQIESLAGGSPRWMPRFSRKTTARTIAGVIGANAGVDLFSTEGASDTPYRVPNLRVEYTPVRTGMPVSYWRSVGHSFNGFFMEGFVDELAHAAGVDPYQFRRRMLKDGSREQRVLDAVARISDWKAPARAGFAKGIARHTSFGTEVAEVAEVGVVDGRIRVSRVWCAIDCGIAVNPDVIAAQLEGAVIFGLSAALDQAITVVGGVVQERNYDDYPALRMFESPAIEVEILDSEAEPSGVGEPGLPPVAAAVANGLFAATGLRLRETPLQKAYDRARGGRL